MLKTCFQLRNSAKDPLGFPFCRLAPLRERPGMAAAFRQFEAERLNSAGALLCKPSTPNKREVDCNVFNWERCGGGGGGAKGERRVGLIGMP